MFVGKARSKCLHYGFSNIRPGANVKFTAVKILKFTALKSLNFTPLVGKLYLQFTEVNV